MINIHYKSQYEAPFNTKINQILQQILVTKIISPHKETYITNFDNNPPFTYTNPEHPLNN